MEVLIPVTFSGRLVSVMLNPDHPFARSHPPPGSPLPESHPIPADGC